MKSSSKNSTKPVRFPKARAKSAAAELLILTIGHSTRPISEFVALLCAHHVTKLIDVRTIPRSRHNPQFAQEPLSASLLKAGIVYEHAPDLGGLRRTSPESPNKGWRNTSFRGYADYMASPEFRRAIDGLIQQARLGERLVLMCAEAVPWRCHRSLIADALLVRGVQCEDIRTLTRRMPHRLTPFAKVRGTGITYPSDDLPPKKTKRAAGTKSRVAAEPSQSLRKAILPPLRPELHGARSARRDASN